MELCCKLALVLPPLHADLPNVIADCMCFFRSALQRNEAVWIGHSFGFHGQVTKRKRIRVRAAFAAIRGASAAA